MGDYSVVVLVLLADGANGLTTLVTDVVAGLVWWEEVSLVLSACLQLAGTVSRGLTTL